LLACRVETGLSLTVSTFLSVFFFVAKFRNMGNFFHANFRNKK
jgi:hypothetical protein